MVLVTRTRWLRVGYIAASHIHAGNMTEHYLTVGYILQVI